MGKRPKLKLPRYLALNPEADILKVKTERNGLGALKTAIVLFLMLLQLTLFIVTYLYLVSFFKWYLIASLIASLITCIYVLSSNKNSQSKPIWILFLIICFAFSYVIYIIANERVFWSNNKKRYNHILTESYKYQASFEAIDADKIVLNECKYLEKSGNFVAYTGSDCKYYPSGVGFFDQMIEDLKEAKHFIFMEFFIISDGVLLERVLQVLEQKVNEGVDVRIIYDDLGSHGTIKSRTKRWIKKLGIKLYSFNKLLSKFSVLLNYRDHRKVVVIDGKVAYTGGVNLADEYVNEKRSHGYWKDCGVRMVGTAVDGYTLMFLRQWYFVSKTKEFDYQKYINITTKTENSSIFVPYADGLEYSDNIGKNSYVNMISNSNEKLYIMSPYYVVDDTINSLLINKAKAGVDVRLILPEVADKKLVYIISRNNAEKLVENGVKVYTMKNSFVHAKLMLNENSAIVGSINLDLRSFYQQFESSLYLNDPKVMADIGADFEDTFKKSTLVTKQNMRRNKFTFRLLAGIVNLISPFM